MKFRSNTHLLASTGISKKLSSSDVVASFLFPPAPIAIQVNISRSGHWCFKFLRLTSDIDVPLKCDLCEDSGDPQCVRMCPTGALVFMPEHVFGQAHRLNNVLSYTHMKEIEYLEDGKPKRLHYADNNAAEGRDEQEAKNEKA